MTQKDYKRLGVALRKTKPSRLYAKHAYQVMIDQWEHDVFAITKALAEDNPHFNRGLWFKALQLGAGAAALIMLTVSAHAGDKHKEKDREKHHEFSPNYILRRQEAGLTKGTPIRSFYVGHRRIDYYRDGSAFEGDYRVN